MELSDKHVLLARRSLSYLFVVAAGYVVLSLLGWFDGPAEKADSEARKCGSARSIQMFADAERYCRNAIDIVKNDPKVQRSVAALVHTEAAALAIVQDRIDESAAQCRLALAAWRDGNEEGREDTVPISQADRQESIHACAHLIAAVAREPLRVSNVPEMRQDVGARTSAPVVLMLKADELRAKRGAGGRT